MHGKDNLEGAHESYVQEMQRDAYISVLSLSAVLILALYSPPIKFRFPPSYIYIIDFHNLSLPKPRPPLPQHNKLLPPYIEIKLKSDLLNVGSCIMYTTCKCVSE